MQDKQKESTSSAPVEPAKKHPDYTTSDELAIKPASQSAEKSDTYTCCSNSSSCSLCPFIFFRRASSFSASWERMYMPSWAASRRTKASFLFAVSLRFNHKTQARDILGEKPSRLRRTQVTFFPGWDGDRERTEGWTVAAHQASWNIYRTIHHEQCTMSLYDSV